MCVCPSVCSSRFQMKLFLIENFRERKRKTVFLQFCSIAKRYYFKNFNLHDEQEKTKIFPIFIATTLITRFPLLIKKLQTQSANCLKLGWSMLPKPTKINKITFMRSPIKKILTTKWENWKCPRCPHREVKFHSSKLRTAPWESSKSSLKEES